MIITPPWSERIDYLIILSLEFSSLFLALARVLSPLRSSSAVQVAVLTPQSFVSNLVDECSNLLYFHANVTAILQHHGRFPKVANACWRSGEENSACFKSRAL